MDRGLNLPDLGVGMTYSPEIEPLIQADPQLCDFLEIEPQTVWLETGDPKVPYRMSSAVLQHLAALPGRKLVHSVGVPVGGTRRPELSQLALLRTAVAELNSPWVSEHLSFNHTPEHSTGFFLPPRQTEGGIRSAVAAVADLQNAFPVPVAVETGVNYLRPRHDELPDGAFVAAVANHADCGIVLDLHNIFANALNGRQTMDEFISQLPRERIWEIHIAGGFELEGYWLDAHSGAIPDQLFEVSKRIVSFLPNLHAIVFEIFPSFVSLVGPEIIRTQIGRLRELWSLKGTATQNDFPPHPSGRNDFVDETLTPAAWKRALGDLVIGRPPASPLDTELASDPGVRLINRLAVEFRGSMVVNVYRLTSRFLMLALGPDIFRSLLEDFWLKKPPQLYAISEAAAFIEYLEALDLKIPQLSSVLRFEEAVVSTLVDAQERVISFDLDPLPMLRALTEGRLPDIDSQFGQFEIAITPDGLEDLHGVIQPAVRSLVPSH